jgi:hypothetical protein
MSEIENKLVAEHFNPAIAKLADMAKTCNVGQSQNALHLSQSVLSLTQAKAIEENKAPLKKTN